MPMDPQSSTIITGFSKVPDFALGMVRDVRVRWACEEIGKPYRPSLMDAFAKRPDGYRDWQPFGQVPAFDDGTVRMFESGAILLYLADKEERLLPQDPEGRWSATSWLIAALNSVEPALMNVVWLDTFNAGKDWAQAALPAAKEFAGLRLGSLSEALGDQEWLTGRFTVADIMMVTVLRTVRDSEMLDRFANLKAYCARGESRPAFGKALEDHMAGFEPAHAS